MKTFFKHLFCCHYWLEVDDYFYGSHSVWDILYHPPRLYKCRDCGKTTVLRHRPVNPEFKPPTSPKGDTPGESG